MCSKSHLCLSLYLNWKDKYLEEFFYWVWTDQGELLYESVQCLQNLEMFYL